jgi:hypothetical protein
LVAANRPDCVFLAAATVGGILANDSRPAEFLYDNLAIETNIIHAAWKAKVEKLLFLARPASTREWRRSRCARTRSSPGRSSLRISGTPSPRSQA